MPQRQLVLFQQKSSAAVVYQSEQTIATVYDATSQTPAVVGKLIAMQALNTNSLGATYSQNATLSAVLIDGMYGIVQVPAAVQGAAAQVCQLGPITALVTTQTSQIVPGTLLQADAVGNLVSVGGTLGVGTVVAVAMGTVVTATNGPGLLTSPVSIPVIVGSA